MIILSVFLLLLLVLVLILGISTASPKVNGVKSGMTMKEVEQLMGPPTKKSTFAKPNKGKSCPEVWEYSGFHVTFLDGKVKGTQ